MGDTNSWSPRFPERRIEETTRKRSRVSIPKWRSRNVDAEAFPICGDYAPSRHCQTHFFFLKLCQTHLIAAETSGLLFFSFFLKGSEWSTVSWRVTWACVFKPADTVAGLLQPPGRGVYGRPVWPLACSSWAERKPHQCPPRRANALARFLKSKSIRAKPRHLWSSDN